MPVDDVAGNGPGRYCSPRHTMPMNSRHDDSICLSMMWRAIFAFPYCEGGGASLRLEPGNGGAAEIMLGATSGDTTGSVPSLRAAGAGDGGSAGSVRLAAAGGGSVKLAGPCRYSSLHVKPSYFFQNGIP